MPNTLIKHDVREGEGSKKSLEKKWDKAKDAAGKGKDGEPNYRLTNYIYQRMKGKKKGAGLEAATRLLLTSGVVTAAKMVEFDYAGKPGRYYPNEEVANWDGRTLEWNDLSKGMKAAIRKAYTNKDSK